MLRTGHSAVGGGGGVSKLYPKHFIAPCCCYISINQSMALSASCAGHTRTQSHAALYKLNNEVVHSGMVASDYKCGSELV